ncbi:MAG TPA: transcription antitermination factor NusB [Geobacteraceae bacterium]|nr:transcription antitermination factor NusB [Geobacteraceae bacterium]
MGTRREGRELALQALYSLDLNPMETRESLRLLRENSRVASAVRGFAEELVAGVMEHREAIDARIGALSTNWSISRITRVDLNILRIAAYELLFRNDIPKSVTMNEAIEVSKKFGTEESPAFINGILDELAATVPDKE